MSNSIISDVGGNPHSTFGGFLQAGANDSIDDVGIRTLKEQYLQVSGQMNLPEASSKHPEETLLVCVSASLIKQKGDLELLDVTYEGPADGGGSTSTDTQGTALFEPVTTLSRVSKQEPLDTHPNFDGSSTSIVGEACDNDGQSEDPEIIIRDSDGAFKRISNTAVDASLRGASSYLAPGAEYTVRYADNSKPPLSSVGKVVENLPLDGPDVSGDFNWLLISVDFTQKGEIYEVTERYLLSGPNGYADSIYDYTL